MNLPVGGDGTCQHWLEDGSALCGLPAKYLIEAVEHGGGIFTFCSKHTAMCRKFVIIVKPINTKLMVMT